MQAEARPKPGRPSTFCQGFLGVGQNPCFLLHWHLVPQMRKRDPLTPVPESQREECPFFSKALKFGICQFVSPRVLWNDKPILSNTGINALQSLLIGLLVTVKIKRKRVFETDSLLVMGGPSFSPSLLQPKEAS